MAKELLTRPSSGDILPAREAIEKISMADLTPPIEVPPIPNEARPDGIPEKERQFLKSEIRRLKKVRNALVIAHNYQIEDIHEVADYSGDSLYLAQKGIESDADVVVEPAVLFMPQILEVMRIVENRKKPIILAPNLNALCSLAAHADPNKILAWKRANPKGIVIMYVNTYVEVKALTDYCCASANAEKVLAYVAEKHPDTPLLFGPDVHLGYFAAKKLIEMGYSIDQLSLMIGACHVHDEIRMYHILARKKEHPHAATIAHRECGCTAACMTQIEDGLISTKELRFGSTSSFFKQAEEMPQKEIIVATENGIIPLLSKAVPGKTFIPANPNAVCEFMKQNTLRNLYESLRDMKHVVTVDPKLAKRAYVPIKRMLEIQ